MASGVVLWPSAPLVVWGPGTLACTRAEAWQAGPPGMAHARPLPAPFLVGGMDGLPSAGRLLTVLEKVNGRPAAVGPRWMCWRQGTARSPLSAGACSPGLLGLALLWRNSSVPPGTLPAARTAAAAKCLSSNFPENQGLGGNVRGAQGAAAELGVGGSVPGPPWCGGLWSVRPGLWRDPRVAPSLGSSPQVLCLGCPDRSVAWDTCPGPQQGQALSLCLSCP